MDGLSSKKTDAGFVKNYLLENEERVLSRIVNPYLEHAELQDESTQPMHMENWISKLDDFLKIYGRDVLTHAGLISHEQAVIKANAEYVKFNIRVKEELSPVK